MTGLIITIILSGVATLLLIGPIAHSKPKLCYLLMVLIPCLAAGTYWLLFGQQPQSPMQNTEIEETSMPPSSSTGDNLIDLTAQMLSDEQYDQAIALLSEAHTRSPENKDIQLQLTTAYFSQGLYLAETGNKEDALVSLETAKDTAPEGTPYMQDLEYFIETVRKQIEANKEPPPQ